MREKDGVREERNSRELNVKLGGGKMGKGNKFFLHLNRGPYYYHLVPLFSPSERP
jgi:hypothetical protein